MQAYFDYLDSHRDAFLDELKRYLRQPSVAAQNLGMAENSVAIFSIAT